MENVGKKSNFFLCQNTLPKLPKNHFLAFLGTSKTHRKNAEIFSEMAENRHLKLVLNFASLNGVGFDVASGVGSDFGSGVTFWV